jgi:hypothetical protein
VEIQTVIDGRLKHISSPRVCLSPGVGSILPVGRVPQVQVRDCNPAHGYGVRLESRTEREREREREREKENSCGTSWLSCTHARTRTRTRTSMYVRACECQVDGWLAIDTRTRQCVYGEGSTWVTQPNRARSLFLPRSTSGQNPQPTFDPGRPRLPNSVICYSYQIGPAIRIDSIPCARYLSDLRGRWGGGRTFDAQPSAGRVARNGRAQVAGSFSQNRPWRGSLAGYNRYLLSLYLSGGLLCIDCTRSRHPQANKYTASDTMVGGDIYTRG